MADDKKKPADAKKPAEAAPVQDGPKDAATLMAEESASIKVTRAKGAKNIAVGVVHVQASFNNTIISITDTRGNVIGWSSSGKMGFKGSRKSTAYAAQLVSQDACRQAMGHGMREAEVRVKGPGAGRESAVRAVQTMGIEISIIKDVTPVPHNGCRPPKARRV
jgi:small subunit ribosomal protein S11